MRYLIILMLFSVSHDVVASTCDDPLPGAERFAALMRGCHAFDLEEGTPCAPSTDISAWLNGLSEDGFLALKSLTDMKSTLEGKEAIMSRAWEADLGSQDLLLARLHCTDMVCVQAFLPIIKHSTSWFIVSAAHMFRTFEACYFREGGFIAQTHTGEKEAEGRALLARLGQEDQTTLTILADADLPTYQLQIFLAYKNAIAAHNIPFLLSLFQDVGQEVQSIYGVNSCVQGQEKTQNVLMSFVQTPPHLINLVKASSLTGVARLTFVERVGALRMRKAQLALTLLEADPRRDVRNLLHKMEMGPLFDEELDAIEALPSAIRRYQFLVSGKRLEGEDFDFVAGLLSGLTITQKAQFERSMRQWYPATKPLRLLYTYGLTSYQSALMMDSMVQRSLLIRILETFEGDKIGHVMALYRALVSGCSDTDAQRITLGFDIDTQESRARFMPFARTLLDLAFSPDVRAELLSRQVPMESLPVLNTLFQGMESHQIKSTLGMISSFPWPAQQLVLVQEARFAASCLPQILTHLDWLESYGWFTPAYLATLKGALEGTNAPHARQILERLFASQMEAHEFAALCRQEPSQEELLETLSAFQIKRFRASRALF